MLKSLLRPFIERRPRNTLPTAELYFTGPLRERIDLNGYIKPLGNNVFIVGKQGVLIRYATKNQIDILRRRKLEKLHYVIDDNIFSAKTDSLLPSDYRGRLAKFADDVLPRILDITTEIVAPSRFILDAPAYYRHAKSLLDPAYTRLCPDLSHFRSSAGVRCVLLGTRSHLADIAWAAPAIVAALTREPKLTLTTFIGHHAPPEFRDHPRIKNRAPLPWSHFREVLQIEKYHIAIAPALPTEFNKARSITRILDHAALGAAGIYSNQPPFSERIINGVNGILLGSDKQLWSDTLVGLANSLQRAESIAAEGRSLAERLGDPRRVQRFWSERLGLDALTSAA